MKYKEHEKDKEGKVVKESNPKAERKSKSIITQGAFGQIHNKFLLIDYELEMKKRKKEKRRK